MIAKFQKRCWWVVLFLLAVLAGYCNAFFLMITRDARTLLNKPSPPFHHQQQQHHHLSVTKGYYEDIDFVPSQIILEDATLQYPVTLARRLFSSVPRREYAVDHISCTFSSEIVLLQGASSSGKSAMMKLITGVEEVTSGKVTIGVVAEATTSSTTDGDGDGGGPIKQTAAVAVSAAKPIMLADKPPFDNKRTVKTILKEQVQKQLDDLSMEVGDSSMLCNDLVERFLTVTHLDEESSSSLRDQKPADLSPSENYRLRLTEACIQSSLPGLAIIDKKQQQQQDDNDQDKQIVVSTVALPAPILLLDEWMDFETRDSSTKVEDSLLKIVETTGTVILCATHKPNLWKKLELATPYTSQMTMCRGEILTLKQHTKDLN